MLQKIPLLRHAFSFMAKKYCFLSKKLPYHDQGRRAVVLQRNILDTMEKLRKIMVVLW